MKTTSLTVSTKKGETQTLRFLIVQQIPYPDLEASGGRIQWRNFGGLFKQYGSEARGIGSNYFCHLLADTAPEIVPDDYNRTIFAGYTDYHDRTKINGGTFTLRRKSLGEMTVYFGANPEWPDIKVNGFDRPSESEREAITKLICPALEKFIAENRAVLKAEAVAKIKAKFATVLREARETLDKLEQQAETAVF